MRELRELIKLTNKVKIKINDIKNIHKKLFYDIKWFSQRIMHYYNRKRLKGSHLAIRDKV
jgi:hypothetical protein